MDDPRQHYASMVEENGAVDPADVHRPKTDEEALREENARLRAANEALSEEFKRAGEISVRACEELEQARTQNEQLVAELTEAKNQLKQSRELENAAWRESYVARSTVAQLRAQTQAPAS